MRTNDGNTTPQGLERLIAITDETGERVADREAHMAALKSLVDELAEVAAEIGKLVPLDRA
jgi:hypothetical protein